MVPPDAPALTSGNKEYVGGQALNESESGIPPWHVFEWTKVQTFLPVPEPRWAPCPIIP